MPMQWTKTSQGWRSGPYLIELLEPGRWALYRIPEDERGDYLVRTPEMTGGSLRRMKSVAESLERDRRESALKRRRLRILLISMIVFVAAAPRSGETAAIVTVIAFAAMLWAGLKLAHRGGRRPWDALREMYQ